MLTHQENSTIVRTRELSAVTAGPAVDAVFAGLSEHSRYLRFHSPIPQLAGPLRRRLTDLDGRHRAALVAEAVDRHGVTPIGIVRLADTGAGSADVAIAVVDAWQRRGVGRRLLDAVAELAARLGYTQLDGLVLPENAAMRGLARRAFPLAQVRFGGDAVRYSVSVGRSAPTVTHEDVLADLLYRGD